MRTSVRNVLVFAAIAALAWLPSCSGLDSGDSADVVLQVGTLTATPITTTPDTANPPGCVVTTLQPWLMNLNNSPKNELAISSPYNDIVLESLTISYQWYSGPSTPDWTVPIGGTVPANGTYSLQFFPFSDPGLLGDRAGTSAGLSMVIRGRSGSGAGRQVSATAGATLVVNPCQEQPTLGACCGGGTCQLLTQTACNGGGGIYIGDNTTCALDPCGGP